MDKEGWEEGLSEVVQVLFFCDHSIAYLCLKCK